MVTFHYVLILLVSLTLVNTLDYCCCLYHQDPFRGFQTNGIRIIDIKVDNLNKEEIGDKMFFQCYVAMNGFPTMENLDRLKNDLYTIDKKSCETECSYLLKSMNEKYNINQEINREKEAKLLKEERRNLKQAVQQKNNENIINLHKGVKNAITPTSKDPFTGRRNYNPKLAMTTNTVMSFDTMSDYGSYLNLEDGGDSKEDAMEVNSYREVVKKDYSKKSRSELTSNISHLDIEIMYLEKKNKRPIDFILDRFNIQDEILVKIIRIFEQTLDEVIQQMRSSFDDTIYIYFKMANKRKAVITVNKLI